MDLRMWGSILSILRSTFACLETGQRKTGAALDLSSPSSKRPTAIRHANLPVGKARYPSTDGWVRAHSIVRMQPISDSSIALTLSERIFNEKHVMHFAYGRLDLGTLFKIHAMDGHVNQTIGGAMSYEVRC